MLTLEALMIKWNTDQLKGKKYYYETSIFFRKSCFFLSISPFNQCHSKICHNNHSLASLIFTASASSPWLRPTLDRLQAISLPATISMAPLLLSRMNYHCFKIIPSTGVLDPIHSYLLSDFSSDIIKLFPIPQASLIYLLDHCHHHRNVSHP